MPKRENYDLSFRPETYWDEPPWRERTLREIQGTARREIARGLLDGELGRPVDAALLAPRLETTTRGAWGRIHPSFMGGEFLPEEEPDEVVVAQLDLDSVLHDVSVVRARPLPDGGIGWRIVDDYHDEYGPWQLPFDRSDGPLSFGELVGLRIAR